MRTAHCETLAVFNTGAANKEIKWKYVHILKQDNRRIKSATQVSSKYRNEKKSCEQSEI